MRFFSILISVYSQNNEETAIVEHFKNSAPGRFLDIGAYDGKTLSNTRRLFELDWSGVCVEASPYVFSSLANLYKNESRMELVNAAVTALPQPDLITWYDSGGDAVSTTDLAHAEKWSSAVKFSVFYLMSMPVSMLLAKVGLNFDMINIDVEGKNLDLFQSLPWELLANCRLICVEHDNQIEAFATQLQPLGYYLIHQNGENAIFAR